MANLLAFRLSNWKFQSESFLEGSLGDLLNDQTHWIKVNQSVQPIRLFYNSKLLNSNPSLVDFFNRNLPTPNDAD